MLLPVGRNNPSRSNQYSCLWKLLVDYRWTSQAYRRLLKRRIKTTDDYAKRNRSHGRRQNHKTPRAGTPDDFQGNKTKLRRFSCRFIHGHPGRIFLDDDTDCFYTRTSLFDNLDQAFGRWPFARKSSTIKTRSSGVKNLHSNRNRTGHFLVKE